MSAKPSLRYQKHLKANRVSVARKPCLRRRVDLQERFERHFEKSDGCWLWRSSTTSAGYGRFMLDGKPQIASRVSYLIYRGKIGGGLFACHQCDTPACVNPEHLFLGCHADNMADCARKGRARGRLTAKDVTIIRRARRVGVPLQRLAQRFGVAPSAIQAAATGRTYAHVGKL